MSVRHFQYRAFDTDGNMTRGQLSADSEREAVAILQARKLVPVKIEGGLGKALHDNRRGVRNADLVAFTNGLCTLIEARVPLDKALSLLDGITEKEHMKRLVVSLRRDVKEGKSLADAMAVHPEIFSKLYLNIIRAGEAGGILDQLLPELARYLEASEETRKQVISALTYPLILVITGVLSVVLLLIYVVPKFTAMFEEMGTNLPASAVFLLNLSDAIKFYGWLLIPLVLLGLYVWRQVNADPERKRRKDAFLLTVPMLGTLLTYRDVAIFSRTLGALLGAGIPLISGMRVAREVVSNDELAVSLEKVEEDVRGGAGLGASLEKTGKFPVLLHQLVAVGEESGRTGAILKKLAVTFDTYVRDQLARLVSVLQPTLILLLGIMVGGIIIVMLSAVFSMNTVNF